MDERTTITPQFSETFDERPMDGMTTVHDRTSELSMTLLLESIRFKDNEFRKDLPDDYISWVLQGRKDQFKTDDEKLLTFSSDEAASVSRKCTSNWHSSLQALFELQEVAKTSMLRIVSVRPDIQNGTLRGTLRSSVMPRTSCCPELERGLPRLFGMLQRCQKSCLVVELGRRCCQV